MLVWALLNFIQNTFSHHSVPKSVLNILCQSTLFVTRFRQKVYNIMTLVHLSHWISVSFLYDLFLLLWSAVPLLFVTRLFILILNSSVILCWTSTVWQQATFLWGPRSAGRPDFDRQKQIAPRSPHTSCAVKHRHSCCPNSQTDSRICINTKFWLIIFLPVIFDHLSHWWDWLKWLDWYFVRLIDRQSEHICDSQRTISWHYASINRFWTRITQLRQCSRCLILIGGLIKRMWSSNGRLVENCNKYW